MTATEPLLKVEGATRRFGGLVAVNEVSFQVARGHVVGLIGPNGAGKSTMFDLITGVRPVSSGRIHFAGRDVTSAPPHSRSPMGMSRTFQIVRLFPGMTVLENVMMGMQPSFPEGVVASLLALPRLGRQERAARTRALELLDYVGLGDRADDRIDQLTLGQLRLVDIGRALAADPTFLMLDEPAAGLNDAETNNLGAMLARLKADGLSMLLVEHDIEFIMNACDRIVVMDRGTKIADDVPDAVRRNDAVIAAYIGKRAHDAQH